MEIGFHISSLCSSYRHSTSEILTEYKKYKETFVDPKYTDQAILKLHETAFFFVFFNFDKLKKFANDVSLNEKVFRNAVNEIKKNYKRTERDKVKDVCNLYSILDEKY